MRTRAAILNTVYSLVSHFLIMLIGLVSQRVFVSILGKEYLGLNGLFNNIMSMLAIAELGFGSAIVANMYKPVAENDVNGIVSLLQFYKKIYRILAGLILGLGILLLAFIPYIVGNVQIEADLRIIFLFYLADTVVSYFVTYKRSILYANQETYYIQIVHTIMIIAMNLLQLTILFLTQNYFWYLAVKIGFRILENISINKIADKRYPYICTKEKYVLNSELKDDIKKKVYGLFFHKIGTFAVLGSDNIIISVMPNLGVVMVGLYSNYLMIINQLNSIITQIFSALTASVGNLLVQNDKDKSYMVFRKLFFMNTWIYVYMTISFYFISFPFMECWMGREFQLSKNTVFILCVNFFIMGMRKTFGIYKEAAGIFFEDRFVPLIESAINIGVSVILGYVFGLAGVFIGTICSNLILYIYSFPKYVYGEILGRNIWQYIHDLLRCCFNFLLCFLATKLVMSLIIIENVYLHLFICFGICFLVPNLLMATINQRSPEYEYFMGQIKRLLKKCFGWKQKRN